MLLRPSALARTARRGAAFAFVLAASAALTPAVHAQFFAGNQAVGGVKFDADGMIRNATVVEKGQFQQAVLDAIADAPADMTGQCETRKVSLKRLDAALRECAAAGTAVPDEIGCLAGLQGIRYVVALPEQNDILLIGPAEGWKVADDGTVVGKTTGKPVLLLDDLLVALRAVNSPTPSVFSCSIDPTEEGRRKVQQLKARSSDPVSRKWAETMTARYDDLSVAEPVFGQLQGCMDLAVAAALIVRKDLLAKAQCDLPMLIKEQGTAQLATPRHVASKSSFARKDRGWVIACGGVQLNPWAIVDRTETRAELAQVRRQVAAAETSSWWSN